MHDFSLEKSEKIENIGEISLYVHKSGGRAVCIDNDDENSVFSLCFDTPAYDDTGIPHILEHCVLCGSKKFPAKDPFNLLDANVPHTYLNAITFPHKTLFPVASTDEKALMLMAGVYCDGVFDPLVCENKGIFMQEGGFYDGKKINGVVYGEMSGFYDDPENLAERYLKAEFTPHFAAGLPEDIPNAGYDELLAYHKKHYTGANCLAFVYGKCDKEPYLALLDKYFTNGGKITQDLTDKSACIKEKYIKERKYIPLPNDVEMALFPVCETKDYVKTHIYSLIAKTLEKRLDGLKVSFDDTGDVAYIKITGRGVDARKISAAAKNMTVNADSLRFYIENGDFGYKPRGLYYGMRLMYSDGDTGSLDFEKIFDKIKTENIEALAVSAFENNGIFGIKGGSLPEAPIYNTSDTKPLEEYQSKKENGGIIPLIVPEKQPFEPAAEQRGGILFTPADGDIIYLTLAFGLDIPPKLLGYAGKLVRNHSVGLPLFSMELCDLGSPCIVMNAGFFADKADEAAREINRIFTADDGVCSINFDTSPERLTDITALGGIERNSCILKTAIGHIGEEMPVPQALREMLYTRENLRASVCCSRRNFAAAEHIIGSLELFDGVSEDKTVFVPDFAPEIIKKNVNVYTISLAFKHSGSFAAAYAAAEIMKTTLLWQKVRGAGAYGSTACAAPNGSFCINSFKDINFEKTIDTFFECIDIMRTFAHDEEEMKRYRLLCLNSADRPKTRRQLNYKALRQSFGCVTDLHKQLLSVTAEDIRQVFEGVDKNFVKTAAIVPLLKK